MIDYYSTVAENGRGYAMKIAKELSEQGYQILGVSSDTVMVPRGEGPDGEPIMVPGYRIAVEDGREPINRERKETKPRWLWE